MTTDESNAWQQTRKEEQTEERNEYILGKWMLDEIREWLRCLDDTPWTYDDVVNRFEALRLDALYRKHSIIKQHEENQ